MKRLPSVLALFSAFCFPGISLAQTECQIPVDKSMVVSGPSGLQPHSSADGTSFKQAFVHSVPAGANQYEETKLRIPPEAIRFQAHSGWSPQAHCSGDANVAHGVWFKLAVDDKEATGLGTQRFGSPSKALFVDLNPKNPATSVSMWSMNQGGNWCGRVLWGDPIFVVRPKSGKCN